MGERQPPRLWGEPRAGHGLGTPHSPWGRCMMPTLKPEVMSPSSQSFTGYRGSQRRTGKKRKSRDLAVEAEHLPGEGAGAEHQRGGTSAARERRDPGMRPRGEHPAPSTPALPRLPETAAHRGLAGRFPLRQLFQLGLAQHLATGHPGPVAQHHLRGHGPWPPTLRADEQGLSRAWGAGARSREGSKVTESSANGNGAAARRRRWMALGRWHPICHPGVQRGVPLCPPAQDPPQHRLPSSSIQPRARTYCGTARAALLRSRALASPPASSADFVPLHMRGAGISTLGKRHGLAGAPAPCAAERGLSPGARSCGAGTGESARQDRGVSMHTRSSALLGARAEVPPSQGCLPARGWTHEPLVGAPGLCQPQSPHRPRPSYLLCPRQSGATSRAHALLPPINTFL